jgi:hypothetical protein
MLTPEEYEAKRQARYERLKVAAERAQAAGESSLKSGQMMFDFIPMGQPILVGHYSEQRDRNYRERARNKISRGYELYKKAEEFRSRAESIQDNDAIYTDDPNATGKLDEKIAALESLQARYKAINKAHAAYIKNPASLDKCELSDADKTTIQNYTPRYSWEPHPIAPYQLTNLSANIRRLKERLQVVSKKQAMYDEDITINGIRIEGRPSENRLRLFYPGRVDSETYRLLRRHGFRVLRSEGEGAFSAYYNNNALYFVKIHIKKEA